MRVAIVGGGIAGLTSAIALGQHHDVTLFERSDAFAAVGAGIVVSANAGRALRSVGVDVTGAGRTLATSAIALADGSPLQTLDLAAGADRLGPTVSIARPDLHRLLADSLPSTVAVRLGSQIDAVDAATSTVTIAGERHSFDLLVGADGINSRVRASLPDPGRVVPANVACWRAIIPVDTTEGPTELLGGRQRIGVVGLARGTYLYLVESAAPGALRAVDAAGLRERFAGFTAARPFLDALDASPRFDDLAELDRPVWGSGRAVLIGDAAHAMTPNLGQGASMAIEDAVVLGRLLRDDNPHWFDQLVEERNDRVRWVQLTSRRLGRALHVRSAPARFLRNAVLRHTPKSVAAKQSERLLAGGPIPAFAPAD